MPNNELMHDSLASLFQDIADVIRYKRADLDTNPESANYQTLKADEFDEEILDIVTFEEGTASSQISGAGKSAATAGDILEGKAAFLNGSQLNGTMPNNGDTSGTITSQGGTVTIPAGYTTGGTVTADLTSGALSAADSSINGSNFTPTITWNTNKFVFGGSSTVSGTAHAKVSTNGYVDTTNNTSKALSKTISATGDVATVALGVDTSGDLTKAPTLKRTAKPNGDTWTDAASGAATTTKPTNTKPYIQIDADANTGTLTISPKVTTAGYGNTDHYSKTDATPSVGAAKATTAYVPITEGTAGTPSASKGTVSNHSISVTPSVTNTTGWITGGTKTGTAVSVSASELVSGNKSLTSSATAQNNIDVTNYATVSVAAIPTSAIDNSIITGSAFEEDTDDYAWKTTVTIPAGYHTAQTIEKTFSSVFPAPESEATDDQVLLGYELFDHDGKKITGTMPNNSATGGTITTQGGTYTIPAGYTSGGTVTANINSGALSAADSSISGNSFTPTLTYNSSAGNFTYGGSANATGTAHAKVSTAGYVASSNNTSKSLSAAVSATGSLAKVGTGVTITGDSTKQPSISRGTPASGDTWTDAASGAATTTKPTSGVYVKVSSAKNTGTLTATPKVTSAGYGTTTSGQYSATADTKEVGALASADTYVPIQGGALSAADSSISGNSFTPTLTYNSTNDNFTYGGSANATGTAHAKVSTAGYVTSSNNTSKSLSATVSATGSVAKVILGASASGTAKVTPSISKQSVPSGVTDPTTTDAATTTAPSSGVYVAVKSGAAANTLTLNPSVSTAGYGTTSYYGQVAAANRQVSVGANDSSTTYVKIKEATTSKTNPTSSATNGTATVTKQPSASASVTATGFTPLASGTSAYYVTASASSGSGTISATGGSASTTAGSVTVSAGYNKSDVTASVTASSASGTSASTTEVTKSESKTVYIPAGSVSVSATKGAVSSNSVSVTPSYTNTAGYIPAHSTAVSGTAVTVSASELVSGNKPLSSSASNQTNIDVTNYATVSISAMGGGTLAAKSASVSATGSSVTLGNASSSAPASGPYIKVSGSGTVKVSNAGYLAKDTEKTATATDQYYPITNVLTLDLTFANGTTGSYTLIGNDVTVS